MGFKIDKIGIHHTGGLGNDPYASTKHLTHGHIKNAHRSRWPNFPSELNGDHTGYTELIFPDGTFIQTRFIGEETAAVKGYNTSGYYPCVIGNFNKKPDGTLVDKMTIKQEMVLKSHMIAVFEGRPESVGLKVKPGAEIEIRNIANVGPHRLWQPTMCYGTGIKDGWARDQLIGYLFEKLTILEKMVKILLKMLDATKKLKASGKLAGTFPASCIDEDVRG